MFTKVYMAEPTHELLGVELEHSVHFFFFEFGVTPESCRITKYFDGVLKNSFLHFSYNAGSKTLQKASNRAYF